MIEIIGLHKAYASRRILDGATLSVGGGESVALVGANGSGKTTTLRCAVGLARPDAGRIRIDGIDLRERPNEARARLSYLAQNTEFPSTLTVREILQVVVDLRGLSGRAVDREISLCGLSSLAGRTVARLSGGERQRIALAALFMPEATAYLMDEPTMNLDPAGARVLVERVAGVMQEGRSVLFTTHVAAELGALATRVAVLRGGRITTALQAAGRGQRHVSIEVEGPPDRWCAPAMAAGARRAWASAGRLHVVITDSSVIVMLARLEEQGARLGDFHSQSMLAAMLDGLSEEGIGGHENDPVEPVALGAGGELWRSASWAGAGTSGPR